MPAMKHTLKLLHEVGTVGAMGAVIVQLVLALYGATLPVAEHAVVREVIVFVADKVLVPSLGITLISGVFSITVHKPFQNAEWAFVKLLMTPLVFEATFLAVVAPAKAAAAAAAKLAGGQEAAEAALLSAMSKEKYGVAVVLLLYVANIVLAIWRPRMRPRPAPPRTTEPQEIRVLP